MSDAKYGRLFTEDDVLRILRYGADRDWSEILEEFDGPGGRGLTFPADEPLFLLRGQDEMAHHGTDEYGLACYRDPRVGEDHARAVATASRKLVEWQRANPDRVKVPD